MSDRDPKPATPTSPAARTDGGPSDFIRAIVEDDLATGKYGSRVQTRFPPEPNGFLHIGHAKSICLNFGVAEEYGGLCNLRFDDTNPETEDMRYVEAIQEDVRWLGFDWEDRLFFASDYFEELYRFACRLVERGKAYVDDLSEEEIRAYRGTVTEPGRESPFRDRPAEESLDLFRRMRAGELPDGSHVLRAKIDMAAANMKMRDPLLYRIRHADHYRTADDWPIYPMYDFAHCLSDYLEGITHSLCTLEFENNRALYDWILEQLVEEPRPQQIEFARLSLSYTVLSKRKLLELVRDRHVSGWDDPRMPTLSGMRRRGYTPSAIRAFCDAIGVAKANSTVDVALLEHAVRDDLNPRAPRVLCVLRPLPVVIENFPEGEGEELEAPYFPHDVGKEGSRKLPFTRRLLIERDDFLEDPPKGFYRLAPGREVRLRYGYLIRCREVVKDDDGEVVELRCTYDPETRGGRAPDGRKVRGTIHWVSEERSLPAEVRLYDRLFTVERPGSDEDGRPYTDSLDPGSLEVLRECRIEPSVAAAGAGSHFQFERLGYFVVDPEEGSGGALVFNRTVSLKDTWSRRVEAGAEAEAATRRDETAEVSAADARPAAAEPEELPQPGERLETAEARERFHRYQEDHALDPRDAERIAEVPELARLFEEAVVTHGHPRAVANWVVNELLRELKDRSADELPFDGAALGELVALLEEGTVSGPVAKELFTEMLTEGGSPRALVERRGLHRLADPSELEPVVARVLDEHSDQVAEYRQGKEALLGFFVGRVMRATQGRADPRKTRKLLLHRLRSG